MIQKALISIAVIMLFLVLIYGKCKPGHPFTKVYAVTLFSHLDLFDPRSGTIFPMVDSSMIFYKDSMILYKMYESVDSFVAKIGGDNKWTGRGIRNSYFIYRDRFPIGFRFDSLSEMGKKPCPVDSFLTENFFKGINVCDPNFDSLIHVEESADHQILKETYVPRIKDSTYPDTTFLEYANEFRSIPYTFSSHLDSTHARKLFRVRMIYGKRISGGQVVPGYMIWLELRKAVFDEGEILKYFDRYEMEAKNGHKK